MMEQHRSVGAVRCLGLLLGMELVRGRETKEPARQEAEDVMYSALSKRLSFKATMGSIITLPPRFDHHSPGEGQGIGYSGSVPVRGRKRVGLKSSVLGLSR